MSETAKTILFFVVIFLANIIQCISGFAGTVLAMPFSIILVGFDIAKPTLNILGILASIGVVAFNFKHIDWKEFGKITLVMLPGMLVGFLILRFVPITKNVLYIILAVIILLFTAYGVYSTFIKKDGEEKQSILTDVALYTCLVLAGVVHGMYVCGGPLLIIYASRKLKERDAFRSTLSMSWIVLNSIILIEDIFNGTFSGEGASNLFLAIGISAVVLVGALLIGNKIAKKLSKNVFMVITYVLMGISALSLILNAVGVM